MSKSDLKQKRSEGQEMRAKSVMVAHTCNPSIQETGAGGFL